MPSFTGNKFSNFYKRILQINQSSNTGVDTTTRNIQDGDGGSTVASISDDQLLVKPINDDTTTTLAVQNNSGNNILAVDTTNSKVLIGAGQVAINTQYAHFGMGGQDAAYGGMLADTHYAIPFGASSGNNFALETIANFAMGSSTSSSFNDTNPSTSLTISTLASSLVSVYWHIRDNITIDEVTWLHGGDAADGDSTAAHLMAYTIDTDNGVTSGDLSGGVVVADGATITNAGREQIYYQQMTIQSANVDAGKVILFIFASDTVNSDYGINATIKYHIR
tara:strand:- start:2199 stop:3035 length:837 start_codon:yes stop_codon:yes gene_type:complete